MEALEGWEPVGKKGCAALEPSVLLILTCMLLATLMFCVCFGKIIRQLVEVVPFLRKLLLDLV